MTEDRKKEIVDEIVGVFRAKGLRPVDHTYGDRKTEACAVGAVTVTPSDDASGRPSHEQFCSRFGVDMDFVSGVINGFQGTDLRQYNCDSYTHGCDVGAAVRAALGSR